MSLHFRRLLTVQRGRPRCPTAVRDCRGATWYARGPGLARRPPLPHGVSCPQRPLAAAGAPRRTSRLRVKRHDASSGLNGIRVWVGCALVTVTAVRQPDPGSQRGGAARQGYGSGLAGLQEPEEGAPGSPPGSQRRARSVGGVVMDGERIRARRLGGGREPSRLPV